MQPKTKSWNSLCRIHFKNTFKISLQNSRKIFNTKFRAYFQCKRPLDKTPYSKMAANKCMLVSSLCLVSMYKTQKKFEVKMRQRGPINLQTKEKNIYRHFGIRCITKLKHSLTRKKKTKKWPSAYLTIILRGRAGYEMIYNQRGA